MFQTITGKPFCPIAAIAAPENFCCAGKLFGGLISQTRTPPECAIQREVRAGSREPSWCGRYEGLCYEGSVSQTHGRSKGSSRNVRHEQPIRHALLEMSDHCAVIRFLPPITISCAIASFLFDQIVIAVTDSLSVLLNPGNCDIRPVAARRRTWHRNQIDSHPSSEWLRSYSPRPRRSSGRQRPLRLSG